MRMQVGTPCRTAAGFPQRHRRASPGRVAARASNRRTIGPSGRVWVRRGRNVPLRWGPGEMRILPPVVSMRDGMVRGSKGGTRLCVAIQRQSRWSGWGFGERAGTPFPKMKRRTFHWRSRGSMPRMRRAWGMQRGRASGPLAKIAGTTPHILHRALSPVSLLNEFPGGSLETHCPA